MSELKWFTVFKAGELINKFIPCRSIFEMAELHAIKIRSYETALAIYHVYKFKDGSTGTIKIASIVHWYKRRGEQ